MDKVNLEDLVEDLKTLSYKEYLEKHLDKNIRYSEYGGGWDQNPIKYSDYIAPSHIDKVKNIINGI